LIGAAIFLSGTGAGAGAGVGTGEGAGTGTGAGAGTGTGAGTGDGAGTGEGDGTGDCIGTGEGAGAGEGAETGEVIVTGTGAGAGEGTGAGEGDGTGEVAGIGDVTGTGDGAGTGDWVGIGEGAETGEGTGVGEGVGLQSCIKEIVSSSDFLHSEKLFLHVFVPSKTLSFSDLVSQSPISSNSESRFKSLMQEQASSLLSFRGWKQESKSFSNFSAACLQFSSRISSTSGTTQAVSMLDLHLFNLSTVPVTVVEFLLPAPHFGLSLSPPKALIKIFNVVLKTSLFSFFFEICFLLATILATWF